MIISSKQENSWIAAWKYVVVVIKTVYTKVCTGKFSCIKKDKGHINPDASGSISTSPNCAYHIKNAF